MIEAKGWDGEFSLIVQSNARYAKLECDELESFLGNRDYLDAPGYARMAVMSAWHRAKESLALHRSCIADWFGPWFDNSAFVQGEPSD